jgi:hypothetical protein
LAFRPANLFQLKGWTGVVAHLSRRSLQAAAVANKAAATKNHPKEFAWLFETFLVEEIGIPQS